MAIYDQDERGNSAWEGFVCLVGCIAFIVLAIVQWEEVKELVGLDADDEPDQLNAATASYLSFAPLALVVCMFLVGILLVVCKRRACFPAPAPASALDIELGPERSPSARIVRGVPIVALPSTPAATPAATLHAALRCSPPACGVFATQRLSNCGW